SYEVNIRRTLKSTNSITSFKVNGNAATIEGDAIGFSFPADSGVDLTKLKPEIVHTGEKVTPDSGVEQDFTDPVEYTVTAENGETRTYTVTIEKELKSTNSITSFKVNGNNATIAGNTISFTFPADSDVDLSKLAPVIEHTGVAVDPGSGVEQDFTDPVEYMVTAENGETQIYTVTMDIALTAAESDRAALMAIYEANPEAQSLLTDWGSEKNLDDWFGVTTNAEGRVTELGLAGLDLKVLPSKIGDLTALKKLDLGYNQLANIPDSIGDLTVLASLDLRFNKLTSIPAKIENLTALTFLSLGFNQLTEIPPSSIDKLTALTSLSLYNNQLTEIPDSIGDLTALTSLSLGENKLTKIPDWIGDLTGLKSLWLNNNQLTEIPSSSIDKLTALTFLSLANNQLTSIPSSVCELGKSMDTFRIDEGLCE
ncbi:leucine-rich repeat domain-containing protein, partial [Allomuricauda taeanensis]|uniref:leucine-rich repeat domain-containing protein n=1 Tax=Flagellimonas taeanensis TaxID=1005926 RepID=UPI002E7AF12D